MCNVVDVAHFSPEVSNTEKIIFSTQFLKGYGVNYRKAMLGRWGEVDVIDTVKCLDHLKKEFKVDTNRSVIMGGSAGGYTTLNCLIRHPSTNLKSFDSFYAETFAAGVNICGVADLFDMDENTHML